MMLLRRHHDVNRQTIPLTRVRFKWSGQHRCVVIVDRPLRGALWQAEEDRVAHRSAGQSTIQASGFFVRRYWRENRSPKRQYEARALVEARHIAKTLRLEQETRAEVGYGLQTTTAYDFS
jgi:hypothetical protein